VATDPRRLRPSELCRLLNSTPLGEVLSERQLHRHRTRGGMRIGDGRYVDLLRYVAWLVQTRHAPRRESEGDTYERMKDRARARNVALAIAGRDIGDLPVVADADRKSLAASDFQYFCESYFPLTFHLPWSADHLKVIRRIEQAVMRGGLFSMAMPRGSGKTTICECACIWAVLNGHREFICLIGSDEGHAMDMLESIKMELDGIANRCNGQLYKGQRTHIGWTAKEVVLPTMPGSVASGAIIKVAGITGRIRGMKYKRADGKTVRPSLVVLDDPQTDESARSLSQCATRESILAGAVLGLAGPGKKISGIMPCTVIRPSDMADNILSRDKHPEWNGEGACSTSNPPLPTQRGLAWLSTACPLRVFPLPIARRSCLPLRSGREPIDPAKRPMRLVRSWLREADWFSAFRQAASATYGQLRAASESPVPVRRVHRAIAALPQSFPKNLRHHRLSSQPLQSPYVL
jgi:hypothetical protein